MSHLTSRTSDPVVFRIITAITFLLGILFVGFTTLNFKTAYLAAHGVQAVLLAFASQRPVEDNVIINRTIWESGSKVKHVLIRRIDAAYVWVCYDLDLDDVLF